MASADSYLEYLGSAVTTTASMYSLPLFVEPRALLIFELFSTVGSAFTDITVRFNGDATPANYNSSLSRMIDPSGATLAADWSDSGTNAGGWAFNANVNVGGGIMYTIWVSNLMGFSKHGVFTQIDRCGGVAAVPTASFGGGSWLVTTDVISSIQVINANSLIGPGFSIKAYGADAS